MAKLALIYGMRLLPEEDLGEVKFCTLQPGTESDGAISKSIIEKFYCSAPAYSYFLGCSRGGGQAMVEAQLIK